MFSFICSYIYIFVHQYISVIYIDIWLLGLGPGTFGPGHEFLFVCTLLLSACACLLLVWAWLLRAWAWLLPAWP